MILTRRAALLGPAALLSGCAGSPLVDAPDGVMRVVAEDPVQDPAFATAATLIAAVRAAVEGQPAGGWRDGALAQCDEQLARFSSADPFSDPEPIFPVSEPTDTEFPNAISQAVDGLIELANAAESGGHALLLVSTAAATHGLLNQQSTPGEGSPPSHVEPLAGQRQNALTHVWALISALEQGLAHLDSKDPLKEQVQQRLHDLKTLRALLRKDAADPAPSQPPYFELPAMTTPAEIATGWAQLEIGLAEALVLLAAEEQTNHDLWRRQIETAQDVGGQIPRWPGWD